MKMTLRHPRGLNKIKRGIHPKQSERQLKRARLMRKVRASIERTLESFRV